MGFFTARGRIALDPSVADAIFEKRPFTSLPSAPALIELRGVRLLEKVGLGIAPVASLKIEPSFVTLDCTTKPPCPIAYSNERPET